MATELGHKWSKGKSTVADLVTGTLTTSDPHGATVDEIAEATGLTHDTDGLQSELEALVMQGRLDRRGIGRGALYTLVQRASRATAQRGRNVHPQIQDEVLPELAG